MEQICIFIRNLPFNVCHFHRSGIKATTCQINNFSIITSICRKCYCTLLSCDKKQLWRNLASVNLKLKKENFLLSAIKFFTLAFLTLEVSGQVA